MGVVNGLGVEILGAGVEEDAAGVLEVSCFCVVGLGGGGED